MQGRLLLSCHCRVELIIAYAHHSRQLKGMCVIIMCLLALGNLTISNKLWLCIYKKMNIL